MQCFVNLSALRGKRSCSVENLNTFFRNHPIENFLFFKTQKFATNSNKVIYNFQFHGQLENQWVVFLSLYYISEHIRGRFAGLLVQIS